MCFELVSCYLATGGGGEGTRCNRRFCCRRDWFVVKLLDFVVLINNVGSVGKANFTSPLYVWSVHYLARLGLSSQAPA